MKTLDPEVIEGSDPELNNNAAGIDAGNGMSYPMLKTYTVGFKCNFLTTNVYEDGK